MKSEMEREREKKLFHVKLLKIHKSREKKESKTFRDCLYCVVTLYDDIIKIKLFIINSFRVYLFEFYYSCVSIIGSNKPISLL